MGECSYNSMSPSTPPLPLPAPAAARKGSSDAAAVQKERPKIRIIHIIAPEIIKTDVANFRELVQRLTGRRQQQQLGAADGAATAEAQAPPPPPPAAEEEEEEPKKETATAAKKRPAAAAQPEESEENLTNSKKKKKIKCEVKVEEGGGLGYDHLDYTDLWMDLNPGGFLSFLEEEEDVFQGMAADLFQCPSRMDFVGEMYAS
ncbi:uncharacterized protein LOC107304365 [Oryza brachyantha]|uniref:uncharacterized protein LOC107304365 n=1 Tax=Oryza brachyantha TaxID=4533 RepID=UPI001AD9B945|nr:uncharacterized protein LOC107304365 [Oryza brachyantha]